MSLDIARARRETPGCERVLHFNNAGAALMPRPVLDATRNYLTREAEVGGYEAAEREHATIERFYSAAAELLGCDPDEIAFVENATRAWDMAFYALPFAPGDRILTARAEYASNVIAFLQVAERTGAVVEVIPSDETGQVSVEASGDDRRPGEADRHHARADQRRVGQPGCRHWKSGAGRRHYLSAGCLPVSRPDAG